MKTSINEFLDIIGKTSEMARLFGIQFLEVMTRGSQFRVESILLRLSKAGIKCHYICENVEIFYPKRAMSATGYTDYQF